MNQVVLSIENDRDYNNESKNGKFHEHVKQEKKICFLRIIGMTIVIVGMMQGKNYQIEKL